MEPSTHILNEQLKRIEPTSKKCTYCDNGRVDTIDDCHFIPLFKVNDRTNIIVYSSVKFSKVTIGVPRCANCKAIHESAKSKALLISLVACFAILAFMAYNFMNFHPIVSVLFTFLGISVGFGGYVYLQNVFTRKKGIHTLKEGAKSDPLVEQFLMNGWSFTQPTA
jgi:hypothetical protein